MASMHNAICQAVKTAIAAMGTPPATTDVRKEVFTVEGDSFPLCLVTEEGDLREVGAVFGGGRQRQYDVRITMLRSGKMQGKTDIEDNPDLIHDIRDRLEDWTVLGLSQVWNATFPPTSGFKAGSVGSGYDQSVLIVTYHTGEST